MRQNRLEPSQRGLNLRPTSNLLAVNRNQLGMSTRQDRKQSMPSGLNNIAYNSTSSYKK
jgi:hypothetical protein